jgi:hypothetical protein
MYLCVIIGYITISKRCVIPPKMWKEQNRPTVMMNKIKICVRDTQSESKFSYGVEYFVWEQ